MNPGTGRLATPLGSSGTFGGAGRGDSRCVTITQRAQREDVVAVLVRGARADVDHAALAARVGLHAITSEFAGERVVGVHRAQEAHVGIAEVGDSVVRDVVDRSWPKATLKDEEIVERAGAMAEGACQWERAMHRCARAGEPRYTRPASPAVTVRGVACAKRRPTA
jgi:hypothetical protein